MLRTVFSPACAALLVALVITVGAPPEAAAKAPPGSAGGKYSELITSFDCPADKATYGSFAEHGYWGTYSWCGRSVPAGFWVWQAPRWYVWRKAAANLTGAKRAALKKARLGGKYRDLLVTLDVPEDAAHYGAFHDHSYYDATTYKGKKLPAAHWVYVAPTWFLFGTKDLAAGGLVVMTRDVKLAKRTVTFRFEYKKGNDAWAKSQLSDLVRGIRELERWSGVPFPGANPYRMYEGTSAKLLGFGGPESMYLAGPPRTSTWTLLHEMLHIWNAGAGPKWVGEGQANFVSYWLMRKLGMKFLPNSTLKSWIADWKKHQGTKRDLPLYPGGGVDNYLKMPQGKAMELWSILYQHYGPKLLRWVFVQTARVKKVTLASLLAYLRKEHADPNPERLFTGWVTPGTYLVRDHTLKAPKFALP